LEARTRVPVDLEAVYGEVAADLVHLHTVVNPQVLEWAGGRRAVITVQDHRYFCPARGKWTRLGEPCRDVLAHGTCAGCFEDEAYFEEVWGLTSERLRALSRLEVVVLSRYMQAELAAAGVDGGRIHVVPPFASGLDGSAAPDGPPCVLFVGRLTESKGVRDAALAWRRSGVDLPLVVAGAGPLGDWARAAGAEVVGWLDRPALSRLYARAAALVMAPRWQEPFGIAGLEALSCGVPVAAWDCGGVAEWHPGGPSLVRWADVDALAAALRWCVGRRAEPPAGFEREALMRRLDAAYAAAREGAAASVVFSRVP
jgi:glycosyltransferase involved in cell wall biosynthesis